jgi:quinoprotein glucose dehydrogenase
VINANFRLGQAANTATLVALANFSSLPNAIRAEALARLSEWGKPSGRDHVTGLWRPLAPRDEQVAATALQPALPELMQNSPSIVKIAAVKAFSQLGIKAGAASAYPLVADSSQPVGIRVEALRSLARLHDTRFAEALRLALADKEEALRKEATTLQAQSKPKDAAAQLRTVLEKGTLGEKQNALTTLAALTDSPAADEILAQWMDKMLAGEVPPDLQLDVLDAAAKRTAQSIKDKLDRFDRSRPAADELRAFRECLVGGHDQEGKKVFLEKVEASCVRCHKINGEGGEVGPDLTGIGTRQNRQAILESIVFPNQQIANGFESAIVTLKNGNAYAGVVKSENDTVLELNSPEDGLLKLNKSEIKSRQRGPSAMPEELRQMLTKQDIRNLVEFLAELK